MTIQQFFVTRYQNIMGVNFLLEKKLYQRQNIQENMDKTSRPFVFI